MEDKKIVFLKKLYKKEITFKQFNCKFGHYALNAYELSSKRFEEYTEKELLSIAELVSNIEIKDKMELEEQIHLKKNNKEKKISILIALRELAKYNVLFIIRNLRYRLLEIEKEHNIKDIFSKSYDEIISGDFTN